MKTTYAVHTYHPSGCRSCDTLPRSKREAIRYARWFQSQAKWPKVEVVRVSPSDFLRPVASRPTLTLRGVTPA